MSATIDVPIWFLVLLALAIVALVVIVWSLKRRRRPRLMDTTMAADTREQSLAGLVHATLVDGNSIELVQNGNFFDRLFDDIEAADSSINIETFLAKEGEVTRRLTDLLVRKRTGGVEVRLLLDGSGGRKFGDADLDRLSKAGCKVQKFHPFVPSNLGHFNQRTHRKLVIIDGSLGYIGGHCLVDDWLGDAQDRKHFRDISARVQGPVVRQLQSAFVDNWMEETGEAFGGETFFPECAVAGSAKAHAVYISPVGAPSTLKVLHYFAIKHAKRSITIQNPYFLPDPDAIEALLEAVRRGVAVRVMLPSTAATDAKLVSHASHRHFGALLEGGVRVLEYEKTLLHQKVFTIDGEWSSVGSANFDDRSFEINDEVSLVVWDAELARQLEEIFEADAETATEWSLEHWKKRSIAHRLKDRLAYMVNEQL